MGARIRRSHLILLSLEAFLAEAGQKLGSLRQLVIVTLPFRPNMFTWATRGFLERLDSCKCKIRLSFGHYCTCTCLIIRSFRTSDSQPLPFRYSMVQHNEDNCHWYLIF